MNVIFGRSAEVHLQSTLSSASAGNNETVVVKPHHPITCSSELRFEPDGSFACDHAAVPTGEQRTRFCVNHSLALLLMELAQEL